MYVYFVLEETSFPFSVLQSVIILGFSPSQKARNHSIHLSIPCKLFRNISTRCKSHSEKIKAKTIQKN